MQWATVSDMALVWCGLLANHSAEIEGNKKAKKLTSSEQRKKKKDRMARRKRGEEVFSDEE